MKILVVGAGTAGLISALILKKFLNTQIDVVYSKDIGIVGVGEGSTEHFNDFMSFIGIDQLSIIKECDATFKSGIMFENWSKEPYLHNVGSPFNSKFAQYPHVYARQILKNPEYMSSALLWNNKIDSWFLNKNENPPFNQYHFNTYKLNEFLIKTANSMGIATIEDSIDDVVFKENEEIDYLIGKKQKYNYDFYIDATGFKKLLISKMGAKWVSFGKYLKMKSAVVFPSPDEDEYNLWTLSKAMDYGWRFKIPAWGKHGNGYIYDSDYITLDQAKEELDKEFGYDVEISKSFNFDPGMLDRAWIKNCVAMGLSQSFIEPLEATSIGSSIQQSYLLMHKIINYSDKEIVEYNKKVNSILENILDYVSLHYITDKKDSKFWTDLKDIEITDSLKEKLLIWKNKMPIKEDLLNEQSSDYLMFGPDNFILIMNGLNLFNKNEIEKEYLGISKFVRDNADEIIFNYFNSQARTKTIGHKKYIEATRNFL